MRLFSIVYLLLVAANFCTSLAHSAELRGNLRLDEAIDYQGFTFIGLVGELGGMIALAVLLYLPPLPRRASGGPRSHSASWWRVIQPTGSRRIQPAAVKGAPAAFLSNTGNAEHVFQFLNPACNCWLTDAEVLCSPVKAPGFGTASTVSTSYSSKCSHCRHLLSRRLSIFG